MANFAPGFTEDITSLVHAAASTANAAPTRPDWAPGMEPVDPAAARQSYAGGLTRSLVGQGAMMGFGDEAAATTRTLFGGDTYELALVDERAKLAAFRRQNPVASTISEIGGAFATPGAGVITGAIRPAATTLGRMGQAAKIGAGFGTIAGAGSADQDRGQGALEGALTGAVVAPLFPLAASMINAGVRTGGNLTRGTNLATGRGAEGAERGADAAMNAALERVGRTPAGLRTALDRNRSAGTFHSQGEILPPSALTELDPAFRRLAGSAVRSSPTARQEGETFFRARQTGETPTGRTNDEMLARYGLHTRNPYEVPAQRSSGGSGPWAAGQHERLGEASKRAMLLWDEIHHKHGGNAYRTEQQITREGQQQANSLYGDLRTVSAGYDVRRHLQPVLDRWTAELAQSPYEEARLIRAALRQFTMGDGKSLRIVDSWDAFDKGKRALDSRIDKALSALNPDKNAARVLQMIKDDMVAAIDGITARDIGPKYKAARGAFSSNAELREAIDLGRRAARENSDITVDHFNALGETQQKLFRLGLLETMAGKGLDRPRSHDITRTLETQRMQDLLRVVIPRSDRRGDVYHNRPERFGEYVGAERSMVESQRSIIGGSPTADKLADDAAFTRQTLGTLVSQFRSSPSALNILLESLSWGFTKVFGYREDVAAALARRMFTANPQELDRIITRLEERWGQDAVSKVVRFVNSSATAAGIGTAGAIPILSQGNRSGQPAPLVAQR